MKLLYNGMEITCTPDEFEDLVIRGLLPGREKLININDNDEWIAPFWENVPTAVKKGPYKPAYTSNVTISQEQLNKLNEKVNKDEQST